MTSGPQNWIVRLAAGAFFSLVSYPWWLPRILLKGLDWSGRAREFQELTAWAQNNMPSAMPMPLYFLLAVCVVLMFWPQAPSVVVRAIIRRGLPAWRKLEIVWQALRPVWGHELISIRSEIKNVNNHRLKAVASGCGSKPDRSALRRTGSSNTGAQ